jgi:pimeloyl-ACP methyl ester carboxylesterase
VERWRLDVRGLGLRIWELTGPGSGPPVVCLHGFLDQGLTFEGVARGRPGRWVAPDQRGFGQSDWVASHAWYHFPDLVADLDALVEHLCVGDAARVDLVGHSMGGTVATLYAAARPERVRRLAVIDGLGPLHPPGDGMVPRLQAFLSGQRDPPTHRPMSLGAAAGRLQRRNPALTEPQAQRLGAEGTRPHPGGGETWSWDPRHRVRSPHTLYEPLFEPFLDAIEAPTLVLWAADGFYPPALRSARASRLRDARVETLPGGHMLHLESPRAVGDRLQAFIEAARP